MIDRGRPDRASVSQYRTAHALQNSGGTGLSARDQTFDIVSQLIDKPIPGFGELFRHLSYQDVGPKAILSRAVAGTYKRVVIYSVPGSTPAVELAVTRIILPTLAHTVAVVRNEL